MMACYALHKHTNKGGWIKLKGLLTANKYFWRILATDRRPNLTLRKGCSSEHRRALWLPRKVLPYRATWRQWQAARRNRQRFQLPWKRAEDWRREHPSNLDKKVDNLNLVELYSSWWGQNLSSIQMIQICSVVKWSGFPMPFETPRAHLRTDHSKWPAFGQFLNGRASRLMFNTQLSVQNPLMKDVSRIVSLPFNQTSIER